MPRAIHPRGAGQALPISEALPPPTPASPKATLAQTLPEPGRWLLFVASEVPEGQVIVT